MAVRCVLWFDNAIRIRQYSLSLQKFILLLFLVLLSSTLRIANCFSTCHCLRNSDDIVITYDTFSATAECTLLLQSECTHTTNIRTIQSSHGNCLFPPIPRSFHCIFCNILLLWLGCRQLIWRDGWIFIVKQTQPTHIHSRWNGIRINECVRELQTKDDTNKSEKQIGQTGPKWDEKEEVANANGEKKVCKKYNA